MTSTEFESTGERDDDCERKSISMVDIHHHPMSTHDYDTSLDTISTDIAADRSTTANYVANSETTYRSGRARVGQEAGLRGRQGRRRCRRERSLDVPYPGQSSDLCQVE